jgi:hypothetical protein
MLFTSFSRYKPETKQDEAKRLKDVAATVVAGKKAESGKKVLDPSSSCPLKLHSVARLKHSSLHPLLHHSPSS